MIAEYWDELDIHKFLRISILQMIRKQGCLLNLGFMDHPTEECEWQKLEIVHYREPLVNRVAELLDRKDWGQVVTDLHWQRPGTGKLMNRTYKFFFLVSTCGKRYSAREPRTQTRLAHCHHILPYVLPYLTVPYHTIPYLTIRYFLPCLTLGLTLPYLTNLTSYLTLSYVLPYHTLPYVLPYLTLPYHTIPYHIIHLTLPYLTSYLTIP